MPCGDNTASSSGLRPDVVVGYKDPLTCEDVYLGFIKDTQFVSENDTVTDDICFNKDAKIPGSRKDVYRITGTFFSVNNPLTQALFYAGGSLDVTPGTPVNVASETAVVGTDGIAVEDGSFIIPIANQHFDAADGFIPADLVIAGATLGTDYVLTRYNEYPAVKILTTGSIAEGDTIDMSYTYTPAVEVCFSGGGEYQPTLRDWFIVEDVTGLSLAERSNVLRIDLADATVSSQILRQFKSCDANEVVGAEFEIEGESFTECNAAR